jgi:hypothetical protein
MNLNPATLNDLNGRGYAKLSLVQDHREYQGEFHSNNISDLLLLSQQEIATYTGIVFDGAREERRTLRVHVGQLNSTLTGGWLKFYATPDSSYD